MTLTPLILQNETLLRALAADGAEFESISALARQVGRDESNLRKSLKALAAEGLTFDDNKDVTEAGRAALAALDRANSPHPPAEAGEGDREAVEGAQAASADFVFLRHDQISPDRANPRKSFDDEAIDLLRQSILQDGLLQNLVVRPAEPGQPHALIAGEMRWRAIAAAIADGDWPEDRPIPCRIAGVDDQRHLELALIENLRRRDLAPLEEAEAFRALRDDHGLSTADIAERISFTQRLVQQRLQLLELSAADQKRLAEGSINIEEARRRLANRPQPIDWPPDQWLMLLEYLHRWRGDPDAKSWCEAVVGADVPQFERPLVHHAFPGQDYETGHTTLRLGYEARRDVERRCGLAAGEDLTLDHLAPLLAEAYAAAGVDAPATGYSSAWLNPPYAISPDAAAKAAVRQAERKADNARWEKERAEREARAKSRQEAELEIVAFAKAMPTAERGDVGARVNELAAKALAPLPWKWVINEGADTYALLDADGDYVDLDDTTLAPLVMAALNMAAGHDPIIEEAAEDEAETDDASPPPPEAGASETGGGDRGAVEGAQPTPAPAIPCAAAQPRRAGPLAGMLDDDFSRQLRAVTATERE